MSLPMHLMYGGTFDPFHNGHLHIARWARDHALAEVFVTPAADPPHRDATGATAHQRLDMVALGIDDEQDLFVDERELRRTGPSYTIDTLHELRDQLGSQRPLGFLLGADSFLNLPKWHRWQELLDVAHIVVAERPGSPINAGMSSGLAKHIGERFTQSADDLNAVTHGLVLRLEQPQVDISATAIRNAIAADATTWKSLVNPSVAEYLERAGLYRAVQR